MVDVTKLSHEPDAAKWAAAFKETFPDADEGLMLGWFANAQMAMHDWLLSTEDGRAKVARLSQPATDTGWSSDMESAPITFGYINYRGEGGVRKAIPKSLRWGKTEWHPEECWLLLAWDMDKQADREFCLTDIQVFSDHPFTFPTPPAEPST